MSRRRAMLLPSWLGAVAALSSGLVGGCAGDSRQRASAQAGTQGGISSEDGQSHCEYLGRLDREVAESVGAGSDRANIRRVFALSDPGSRQRGPLACREVDTNLDGNKDVVRFYDDQGAKIREFADANHDGTPDTWTFYSRDRIARVEWDRTGNGRPDEIRRYVRGQLNKVEVDTNGDGRPDVWEMYDKGRLDRMGEDLDFDGRVDRWSRAKRSESKAPESPGAVEPKGEDS